MIDEGIAAAEPAALRAALDRLLDLSDEDRRWLFERLSPAVRARLYEALHDRTLEAPPPKAHLAALPMVLRREPDWLVRCLLRSLDPVERRRLEETASRTDRARWERLERDPWSPGAPLQAAVLRNSEQHLGALSVEDLDALESAVLDEDRGSGPGVLARAWAFVRRSGSRISAARIAGVWSHLGGVRS